MFVTDLIKHKDYRDFLDATFNYRALTAAGTKKDSPNPSLTGNAFEIFFLLFNSNSNPRKLFKQEFVRAEQNISALTRGRYDVQNVCRHGSYIKLLSEDYKRKISVLEKVFENTKHFSKGKLDEVNYVKLRSSILSDLKSIVKAQEETELFLWPSTNTITIYDVDSLSAYYTSILHLFLEQVSDFRENGRLTKTFLKNLLRFTHLSHPFFLMSEPLTNIYFDDDYIKALHSHFKQFSRKFKPIRGKIIKQPSLKSFKILATPDFIINGKIIELKTSQKASKRDYHQALSYLLFAQFPENRKAYGKITSVVIYYSLFNQQLEIKLDDLKLNLTILNKVKAQIQSFYKQRMKRYEV